MASILEKLLTIQGTTEQLSIDTLSETVEGAKRREEPSDDVSPISHPTGPVEAHTGKAAGIQKESPSPEMLEVWREAFRIYTRYGPAIRAAAASVSTTADGSPAASVAAATGATNSPTNSAAAAAGVAASGSNLGGIFLEASERVKAMARFGEDGEIVGIGVLSMLDDLYSRSYRRPF